MQDTQITTDRLDKRDNQARIGTKYCTKELETINKIYFTDEHVLGTEIAEILDIPTSYISNLKSERILKVGNCPILLKSDPDLLPKIKKTLFHEKVTSLKHKMVLSYFKSEYLLSDSQILDTIGERIEIIAGKKFIVFRQDFLDKIIRPNNIDNVLYSLDSKEFNEVKQDLKHFYKITDKKYLVIY